MAHEIEEIRARNTITEEEHLNRNKFNELPTGKLTLKEKNIYVDENNDTWVRYPDYNASYHQPCYYVFAAIRSLIAKRTFGFLKVPNLTFKKENEDLTSSEVVVNRYDGKMVLDPKIFGTYNFGKTTDYKDENGNDINFNTWIMPPTGSHDVFDIIPHHKFGGNYKHVGKYLNGLLIETPKKNYKGDIILMETENLLYAYAYNIVFSLILIFVIRLVFKKLLK
tara:strand:+ start:387 stop:1055 length:669 start_codon:yes stop_codon:yes gene_type:complete